MNDTSKKFCFKCGTALESDASFCPVCGEKCSVQMAFEPVAVQQYNQDLQSKMDFKSSVNIKKTVLGNVIPVACLAIGIILILMGIGIRIPSDYISSYSMTEYVGGDAYNFIIEASLRGGRIAAAEISKGLYICAGVLTACMSALKIKVVKEN